MKSILSPAAVVVGIALLFFVLYQQGSTIIPGLAGEVPSMEASDTEATDMSLLNVRAPYFDLPNINGDHVTLDSFSNTPLVVVFWTTTSGDGADQIKILDDYLASPDVDQQLVQVVAINSQEEKSVITAFMRRGGYTVPTLIDSRGVVTEQYKVRGIPVFYFLDGGGVVREIYTGILSARMVGDKVEQLLRGATL
ncbi:MAG: TlpA disulfide reductase family protein [Patescibacteria group bacterium]